MLLAEVDEEEADQEGEPPTSTNPLHDLFQQVTREGSFAKEQKEDDRLRNCWSQVTTKAVAKELFLLFS